MNRSRLGIALIASATWLIGAAAYRSAVGDAYTAKAAEQRTTGGYSFRGPTYSLLDEPQRTAPRTTGRIDPAPAEAVVFGWPIRWWSSHWSAGQNTASAAMLWHETGHPRFVVTEPGRRKVWVKYFDVPIDPNRYQLAVMTYRATGTDTESGSYVLYLDDGSGPDYGGLLPFAQQDVVPDGQVHTLTCDIRALEPIGDLIGLAVGVHAGVEGSATFDLIDLRFEALEAPEFPEVVEPGPARQVLVLDQYGQALVGATVAIDAERANWQRSATTDVEGRAVVVPRRTKSGRHMIRVTKAGMLPVELRDLPAEPGRLLVVVMASAARYGGTVLDENGEPLSNVAVRIRVDHKGLPHQWTRRDAEALTDEQGRWQSPPMPAQAGSVRCELAHPGRSIGPRPTVVLQPSVAALRKGESQLGIRPSGEDAEESHEHPESDGRRPGYDPFKIFRQRS